jgi:hypothetical protein
LHTSDGDLNPILLLDEDTPRSHRKTPSVNWMRKNALGNNPLIY